MRRVGIFDPAFKKEGHFIPFNRYIAKLVDDPDTQLVFFDTNGLMREVYAHEAFRVSPEFKTFSPLPASPSRAGRFFARYRYWKEAFRAIDDSDLDVLILTAEARDALMYAVPLRTPVALFLLYPRGYALSRARTLPQLAYALLFKRFAGRALVRFSTSEPPLLPEMRAMLGTPQIEWVPNMPVTPIANERTATHTFLTIGTISKSKNHLFALTAFKEQGLPYSYHIAGAPLDAIGEEVRLFVEEHGKAEGRAITGEFGYLSSERYDELMRSAEFMLFPYDFTRGSISSQVLHDSFSYGIPIIAPAIQPFKWYVERYGIGLLYTEGDRASFAGALRTAAGMRRDDFKAGFAELQQAHSLETVRENFRRVLSMRLSRG